MTTLNSFRLLVPVCALVLSLHAPLLAAQGGPPPAGMPGMQQPGPPPTPEQELQRMTQLLTLTDAQQAAVLPILQRRQAQLAALRAQGTSETTRMASMLQARVVFDSTNAEIRQMLTPAQQAIFDKMQPPPPPGGGQHVPGADPTNGAPSDTGTTPPPAPPQ